MPKRLISTPRRAYTVLVLCSALFALGLTASGYAIYDRFNQTDAKRAAQQDLNHRLLVQSIAQKKVTVDLLCFTRGFSLKNNRGEAARRGIEDFIHGALKSVHASPDACDAPRVK